jgi:hypothetical protein
VSVRYRPMQPKDVAKCVEHIAVNPVLAPRYGASIEYLPPALRGALGKGATVAVVFEEFQDRATKFLGVGIAVFTTDDFLHEVKSTPNFWIAPELSKRIARGVSPLLSDAQVRESNSTVGLNLVVWHDSSYPEDMTRAEVGTASMNAFDASYRGYRLREVISQADCIEHMWVMHNAGGLYFDQARGHYGDFPKVDRADFSDEPRSVGMTRELALTHGASWVGSMFLHPAPQFGFTRSEQRQLSSALTGATDEELAHTSGISLFTVKTTWRAIYDRVATSLPDLVPDRSQVDGARQGRGKQKKQRLLDYLREHPEELRPVSRKLLRQAGLRVRVASKTESALDTNS